MADNRPTRDVFDVMKRVCAALPADSELHRVAAHTLASLVYQPPECAWQYAFERMGPAFFNAETLTPRPGWFDQAVAIWMGKDGAA